MNRRVFLLVTGILIGSAIVVGVASVYIFAGKPTKPPDGSFKSVSAAGAYACGVRSDDTIDCWGRGSWIGIGGMWGQIPNGRFKSVETGDHRTCGIRQDDSISCWWHKGYDYASDGFLPPPGSFKQVVVGDQGLMPLRCALKFGGIVICWRDGVPWSEGIAPQVMSEDGVFKSLSDYRGTICRIRADDTIGCWGDNHDGEASPPGGKFISVSMGYRHACGIRGDNTVACWGYNEHGRTAAPRGHFTAVAAGSLHTCGIRTDGSIECWGDDENGEIDAPSGSFTAISAGSFYTCGVRTDGTVVCWGR